jgi:hypothetical protein
MYPFIAKSIVTTEIMLQQSLSLEISEASAKKGATKIAALNG